MSSILTREKIFEIARAMPVAPRIFADIERLLRDANSPLDQIAASIKRDPALSAQIIRVSNSVIYGGEQRMGSVEEAVSRIGFQEVFRLVGYMAGAQLAERALKNYGIETEDLRTHMVYTAFVCEQLAAECGIDTRTAYTTGLMRPLGLFVCDRMAELYQPVVADRVSQTTREVDEGTADNVKPVVPYHPQKDPDYLTWEGRLFGVGSNDIAAIVLTEWRFPEAIVEAVRRQYAPTEGTEPHRLACIVNLASGFVADDGNGLLGEQRHWGATAGKLEAIGLTTKRFRTISARARELFTAFQQRMVAEPAPAQAPAIADKSSPAAISHPGGSQTLDSCDFSVQVRVIRKNHEPEVHPPEAQVATHIDFTTFMRSYQDMVYSTAVRLLGNETQAEDIAQEVFIKAYEHFDNLRASQTAGGWLKTVATNLSINHIQRYKKRWTFFSDIVHRDDEGGEKEVEFAAPDSFFSGVDSSERREWIERALEKLPEHQRVPLVLYHFEDMHYEEIAKKTRVSLSKVKTDMLRGREALAKILVRSGSSHEQPATILQKPGL